MLIFKRLRWRNFLSTGNEFTEIHLDKSPATLITGKNGAGKSTLIDALTFSLFGKPHRNISKPMLMNSVNNKDCRVELEFSIGSRNFKIVRGIKPGIFEIYQDGTMINQDASAKDYQKFLEKSILKLDFKSFHQIVVLGSSSFIPFMQLPVNKRREIVENILDIDIFSKMNNLLKQRVTEVKNQVFKIENAIELISSKVKNQQTLINRMKSNSEDVIEVNENKLTDLNLELSQLEKSRLELSNELEKLMTKDLESLTESLIVKQNKLHKFQTKFEHEINDHTKHLDFFNNKDVCPTCDQNISEDTRNSKKEYYENLIVSSKNNYEEASTSLNKTRDSIDEMTKSLSVMNEIKGNLKVNSKSINLTEDMISSIKNQIDESQQDNSEAISKEVEKQNELLLMKNSLYDKKSTYIDDREYYVAASELLKDTGIKTKIIKEYVPIMNKMINQYLGIMDFFVSFHFDENFNEEIRSRHRDSFKYSSFSEGEKSRIDLSLLFTWRHIAKLKNSTNTNLLILDETFDSSVDSNGMGSIQSILHTLTDTSVFVISHRESMEDSELFRNKITFVKDGNFSKMV